MLALSRLSRPLQDLVNQGHAWPKTSVSPGKGGADSGGPWLPPELLHPTTAVANMLLEAGGGVYALQLLTPSLQHLAAMVNAGKFGFNNVKVYHSLRMHVGLREFHHSRSGF